MRGDIERIYGCSIGAILGCLLALDYEWAWAQDYLVLRPWERVAVLDERLLQAYTQQGIFGEEFFLEALGPLLRGKGMETDVTLEAFCEETGVELYLTAVDLNAGSGAVATQLSPQTHGEMPLVSAVWASCAYPLFFKPVHYGTACYVDGGIRCHYPIQDCLDDPNVNPDEVLGIRNAWADKKRRVEPEQGLGQVLRVMVQKLLISAEIGRERGATREVLCDTGWDSALDSAQTVLVSPAERLRLIGDGTKAAVSFIKEHSSQTDGGSTPLASRRTQQPHPHEQA